MYHTQNVRSGMKTGKATRLGRPMMSKGLKCTMRSVATMSTGCLKPRMVPYNWLKKDQPNTIHVREMMQAIKSELACEYNTRFGIEPLRSSAVPIAIQFHTV